MPITVHIIDSSKPSLVMSSEAFKDKIPGSIVSYSLTAKDGLIAVQAKQGREAFDALVVDFNLPDADGVSLIKELRKFYKGPIFMTAYPDKIVDYAVREELFHYHDACCWIPKPVRYDVLEKRIEQFLVNRHRLGKRFDVNYPSLMIGKGEGRGKRAPKFDGRLINISMGGLCLSFASSANLKRDEEFVVTMGVPEGMIEGATAVSQLKPLLTPPKPQKAAPKVPLKNQMKTPVKAAAMPKLSAKALAKLTPAQRKKELAKVEAAEKLAKEQMEAAKKAAAAQEAIANSNSQADAAVKFQEYKVKATVAWLSDGGKKVGLQFNKIPDSQRRQIETFLKGLSA